MSGREHAMLVKIQIRTQKIKEEFEHIINSTRGLQLQPPGDSRPSGLLIMELGDDPTRELEMIRDMQSSRLVEEVFLTAPKVNSEILISALRVGIKEFFPQPIQRKEVKDALARLNERRGQAGGMTASSKNGRIINVLGSKGGVGTTTVAVNLAVSLTGVEGKPSVAIIDMNPHFGEVPLFLSLKPTFDWTEVVKNVSRLDVTYLMSTLSRHDSGIHVLPSSSELTDEYRPTPEVIEKLLGLMRTMFDFVVIDSGQGLDEGTRELLKVSDAVLLITQSSLPCLINVKKILSAFRRMGYPPEPNVHLLMNRFLKKSMISVKEAEESLNKKFLACLPNDFLLTMGAINQGKPLAVLEPKAEVSRSLQDLALILSGRKDEGGEKKKKLLFGFM